jgi:hypothetical protein
MHRLTKVAFVVIIAISAIITFCHVSSKYFEKCSLEKALGLMHLPQSVKILEIRQSTLLNETLEGYIEISPKDFPVLLSGRIFSELPLSSDPSPPISLHVPPDFIKSNVYKWTDGGDIDCIIRTTSDRSKVRVSYCHHWR